MQIELPARPGGRGLTLAVLACSVGTALVLFLHGATWPALGALLLAAAGGCWPPVNRATTLRIEAAGACQWASPAGQYQGRVGSVFSACGIGILRVSATAATCRIILINVTSLSPLRGRAGRWLNAAGRH